MMERKKNSFLSYFVVIVSLILVILCLFLIVYFKNILNQNAEEKIVSNRYFIEGYSYTKIDDNTAFIFLGNGLVMKVAPIYKLSDRFIVELKDNGTRDLHDDVILNIYPYEPSTTIYGY